MNAKIYTFDHKQPESSDSQITKLCLWLTAAPRVELIKTAFCSPAIPDEICAVRGKTAGAFTTSVTFQWTPAVQALSVLLVRAAIQAKAGSKHSPLLEGDRGSLAASLDAALYKQTAWLDLFGASVNGDPLSRRILVRTNPGLRRLGPVTISLNEKILPRSSIDVFIDNKPATDIPLLERAALCIESQWNDKHSPLTSIANLSLPNPLRL